MKKVEFEWILDFHFIPLHSIPTSEFLHWSAESPKRTFGKRENQEWDSNFEKNVCGRSEPGRERERHWDAQEKWKDAWKEQGSW